MFNSKRLDVLESKINTILGSLDEAKELIVAVANAQGYSVRAGIHVEKDGGAARTISVDNGDGLPTRGRLGFGAPEA